MDNSNFNFDSLTSPQGIYDAIDSYAFKNWSDSSKSSFFNVLLNEKANQHEIDMWNLQNEYNSPVNQVMRMKEAGLNPNLFYSQGNPGNNSSAPGTHRAEVQFGEKTYKMQMAQMILDQINQFAQGVASLVDTSTKIDQRLTYENPLLHDQKYLSDLNVRTLENTVIGDKEYMDVHSPKIQIPLFKIGDKQYYYGNTQDMLPIWSPQLMDSIGKYAHNYYYGTFQDMYQKHMSAMYPDLEKRAAAVASIQEYLKEFYDNIPKEAQFLMPLVLSFMRLFLK